MARPSVWWPTPARPADWFTLEEMATAASYNDPLRRVAALRNLAQVALVLTALAVLPDVFDEPAGLDVDLSALTLHAVALGSAWWLPNTIADAWSEFAHERRFPSAWSATSPILPQQFAVGSAVALVGSMMVSAVVLGVWATLQATVDAWPVVIVGLAATIAVLARRSGSRIAHMAHQTMPLDPADVGPLALLASRTGAPTCEFRVVDGRAGPPRAPLAGMNAFVAGNGAAHTVVLSSDLAAAPQPVLEHVVAHELAHVRRRDLSRQAFAWSAAMALALVAGPLVAEGLVDRTDRLFVSLWSDLGLRVVLSALIGAVALLPVAWLSRAHERRADLDALSATVIDSVVQVRAAFVTDRAELRVRRRFGQLWATHPTPAERLELAHRALRP